MKIMVKLYYYRKNQLKPLLVMFRIGASIGFLPIKFNPLKLDTKDNPFESSWVLLAYSCSLWLICTVVSVHSGRLINMTFPQAIFLIICTIHMYFIFWIILARRSIPRILNKLIQITKNCSTLRTRFTDWSLPFFPIVLIFFTRIVLNFHLMIKRPHLTFLDFFSNFGMVFTNGFIYIWIVYGERIFLNIDNHIRWNRRISVNKLRMLLTQYLETESFLYLISKSCGIPYLAMSIVTVSVDIMYSNNEMHIVNPTSYENGLQYLRDIIDFVNWNYSLYIMACVCYRSHKLNIQVKNIMWNLDEIRTKGNFDFKVLQTIDLFKRNINIDSMYFSALGGINFDISLIIIVLNKIIIYLFAISPMTKG